jgi:hypothetical protein
MKVFQENIYNALIRRSNWCGNNTFLSTNGGISSVVYYRSEIATIDHVHKTAKLSYCGYHTVSTGARINACKMFCERYGYEYSVD